jgi:hypothetical protein
MAIKRRLKGYSGFRVDLSHLRLLESAITGDFDDLIMGALTGVDKPYVLRGFDPVGSTADVNSEATSFTLKIADSALLHPTATEAGSILRISPSEADIVINANNSKVIGDWVPSSINYVALDYRRITDEGTVDQTYGWSASEKLEITKAVPIGYTLDFRIVLSTTGFGNFLPLYKVQLDANGKIVEITKSSNNFWRLGTGGVSPDPSHNFSWVTGGNPSTRIEGPMTFSGSNSLSTSNNAWGRGDFAIKNLKDALDAIYTRFKEITGSPYWYADGNFASSPITLAKTWWDSVGSVMMSSGAFALELKADVVIDDLITTQNTSVELAANIASTNPVYDVRVIAIDPDSDLIRDVTFKSSVGYTRTLTTSVIHTYTVGEVVIVEGVSGLYDGTHKITAVTANTLSYETMTSLSETTVASFGEVKQRNGEAKAKGLPNSNLLRLSQVNGVVGPGNQLHFRLKQIATNIVRVGDVATINLPNAEAYRNGPIAIVNLTVTNREATVAYRELDIGAHTLAVDDIVRITGISADYNGDFRVTAIGATTFQYAPKDSFTEASTASSGTVVQGDKFIATITGAVEGNFNRYEKMFFILQDTPGTGEVAVKVDDVSLTSEAGSFNFDGLLATGTVQSTPTAVGAGPFSWTQDIYIKSIIGTKQFVIPYDAEASAPNNTYGPGTVDIQANNEVAYVTLHRDLPLGTDIFSITNSTISPAVIGKTYTGSDGSTQTVQDGDYIRVSSDAENKWFKVNSANQLVQIDEVTLAHQSPTLLANYSGVTLYVSKYQYDTIQVKNRQLMPDSGDIYWLAVRQDKQAVPNLYLREMELEMGEERDVNDNTPNNLLLYTGAMSESAVSPNYSQSMNDESAYAYEQDVTIIFKDDLSNTVYLQDPPGFSVQAGDVLVDGTDLYTIAYPLNGKTFVTIERINALSLGVKSYRRLNTAVADSDNLTKGTHKIDRMLAQILTVLERPIYDESVVVQRLELDPLDTNIATQARTIRSGYWITAPGGGLAWVLAASNDSTNSNWISHEVKDVAGTTLFNALLIHVVSNPAAFVAGAVITQEVPGATVATRTIDTGAIQSQGLWGDPVNGQLLRLPPNSRVGISDNGNAGPLGGKVHPPAVYNAKIDAGGGELFVIINDLARECNVDYLEDVDNSGPAMYIGTGAYIQDAAQITLKQPVTSLDNRVRFRNLATFGLPPIVAPSSVTLQSAYNGPIPNPSGYLINTVAGVPVQINNTNAAETVLSINGRIRLSSNAGSALVPQADLTAKVGDSGLRIGEMWTGVHNISNAPAGQFSGTEWTQRTAGVQTFNAALTDIFVLPCNDQRTYRIKGTVVARRTDLVGAYASFTVEAAFYRDGGQVYMIGDPITTIIGQTVLADAYIATVVALGNTIKVQVAGDSGHSVSWAASLEYQSVSSSS